MARTKTTPRRQAIRVAVQIVMLVFFPATFYYFSPVISLQGAANGIVSGSLVLFGLLFLTSIVAGRLFCAWVCPGGAIGDLATRARSRRLTRVRWVKYLVWAPWLVTLVLMFTGAGGVQGVEVTYGTTGGLSISSAEGLIAYLMVAAVFVTLSLSVGRRASCHTICWMSPFMILGRSLGNALGAPALRLASAPESCRHCGRCTDGCPMSLPVQQMAERGAMEHTDCILCGECVDVCPASTISYRFGRPSATVGAVSRASPGRTGANAVHSHPA